MVCFSPIPQPLTPSGGKGGFNSRFDFFASATRLRLVAWCGFAQIVSCGGAHPMRDHGGGRAMGIGCLNWEARCLRKQTSAGVGLGCSRHWGRAEQRSGGRIRAGACLSVASLRTTPPHASSARDPAAARSLARLSFAYFSLAKQRKVSRPPGRNPACHATTTP